MSRSSFWIWFDLYFFEFYSSFQSMKFVNSLFDCSRNKNVLSLERGKTKKIKGNVPLLMLLREQICE